MGMGLTENQRSLARLLGEWATSAGTTRLTKDSEDRGPKVFETVWDSLTDLGVPGIPVPEALGGAGGSLLDVAVAVEACAGAMVPGPVLPTLLAAVVLSAEKETLEGIAEGSLCVGVGMGGSTVRLEGGRASGEATLLWGARMTTRLLVPTVGAEWLLLPAGEGANVAMAPPVDLSCRVGAVQLDALPVGAAGVLPLDRVRLHEVAVVLASAEAAGIARWCLDTAVAYAKVREQFGRPIGSFQAIKHLCVEMLEAVESATAVAWDAAGAFGDEPDQFSMAAAVAGAVALDAAVVTAQNAIQVLGGIGFTWEHDVHLYLRRAMVNRQLVGGSDFWRLRLADLALAGVRRRPQVDLGGAADRVRTQVRP
ncbi:MAG: 3-oxochol-4-en-24-oyl-CoA dehydrogenase, partial [Nocardioidaceae bacterium]|nr:3-oxochol-4-en-24-oyl-CoA dehydrogenase [Nocardioidaceae bacterium]